MITFMVTRLANLDQMIRLSPAQAKVQMDRLRERLAQPADPKLHTLLSRWLKSLEQTYENRK